MAYQRPMVTVDQNMTTTPTSVERDQPAFIFGPNYHLHRYSNADEKQKTFLGTYDGSALQGAYPGAIDGAKVDTSHDYTKLTGDDVVVRLCQLIVPSLPEKKDAGFVVSNGGYTKLDFEGKRYINYDVDGSPVDRDAAESGTLNRNLEVGDYIWINYTTGNPAQTKSLLTKIVDVAYDAAGFYLDSDSSDEGAGGTLVTLYDSIPVDCVVTGVFLVDVLQGVEFVKKNLSKPRTGDAWAWEEGYFDGSYGVKVNAGSLFAEDVGYFGDHTKAEVLSANLYVTFRELLTEFADTFHYVTGSTEVATTIGTVDPDNPLAYGVYMAALNAATDDGDEAPPVYFMAVPSDDLEGYAEVLKKATLTDRAYVFSPTTQDDDVLEILRNHVLAMSTKTVKMWRIAVGSSEVPLTEKVIGRTVGGLSYFAIPITSTSESTGQSGYNQFRIVKSKTDINGNTDIDLRSTHRLVKGDIIKVNPHTNDWGETDWDEYSVVNVINRNTVEVTPVILVTEKGYVAGEDSYEPVQIEAYHKYTDSEFAEKVASISRHWASRRMINVFPTWFENDGESIPGMFAACAVAGLISGTEPQQPITNMTVRGIDNVPLYRDYGNEDLDVMAAGGTFIVAQDLPDDVVYVRHQITTAYPDGNLNTAELSITKNVDSISYAFADVFRPYYGKYNITPELVAILENLAGQLISQFGGSTSVYGPQLITDETAIKYVRQNALMKDHVDVAITLGVPYPCNNIDIVLTV